MVTPVSQRFTPQNLMLDRTGWSPQVCENFIAQLEEAQRTGNNDTLIGLKDSYDKAVEAAGPVLNAPQTGVTNTSVASSQQGIPPQKNLTSANRTTLQRTHAPNPNEAEIDPPTREGTQQLVGAGVYDPAPELPPNTDVAPAADTSGAGTGNGSERQPQPGVTVNPPELPPGAGPASSVDNSPAAMARRERLRMEAQNVRPPAGKTWDRWEADRTRELTEIRGDGSWEVNPRQMAEQANTRLRALGHPGLNAAQLDQLEIDIHNHFAQNGGLIRSGGEYARYARSAVMGGTGDGLDEGTQALMGTYGMGGSVAAPLVGSILGTGAGMMMGSAMGPAGMAMGGAMGGGMGMMAAAMLSRGAAMNPMMTMMPGLAMNPVAMGMGGGLGTLGMLGSFMGGGGMMTGMERMMAGQSAFQYQAMNMETRLKRLMHKQATLQGDTEMVRMLTSSNLPIEKLVAMWSLKNCRRYEQELRDKMLAAEDARQREKMEKNREEAMAGIGGIASMGASLLGFAVGGPIGGMVGGMIGQGGTALLSSAIGGGGDGRPPESAAALQLEVQMALEEWKRSYELASNILKSLHDMAMTAINNTRG